MELIQLSVTICVEQEDNCVEWMIIEKRVTKCKIVMKLIQISVTNFGEQESNWV